MIRKIFPLILLLLLLTIYCDDNGNDNTPPQPTATPTPTPTPSYADIRCAYNETCKSEWQGFDYCVRNEAVFCNYGTATGTRWVKIWVEQPWGVFKGSFITELTLYPGQYQLIGHLFCEVTWDEGDIYCWCGVN